MALTLTPSRHDKRLFDFIKDRPAKATPLLARRRTQDVEIDRQPPVFRSTRSRPLGLTVQ
ncbi:hypothetical protein GQ651_16215 [Alphaproteobacteria bacterium GH1-50]|uniref:Uncharacterized protein n=1 Tax=Kangsaoukella pontilimi TaxID=2691042 RepID=A0A7C9MG91_9RHOB|nr:hypothetical protein [Kangsaoukella pontilimi]MXQ09392.1 hypothetical protein [Kangsaoukella pontilimi]